MEDRKELNWFVQIISQSKSYKDEKLIPQALKTVIVSLVTAIVLDPRLGLSLKDRFYSDYLNRPFRVVGFVGHFVYE